MNIKDIDDYKRVLPRDAFNEGNLLKCIGKLFLLVDDAPTNCELIHEDINKPFRTIQDEGTGDITVTNVYMVVEERSHVMAEEHFYNFWRPCNSRESWPLYVCHDNKDIYVFTETGSLTNEFKRLIGWKDYECKDGDQAQ